MPNDTETTSPSPVPPPSSATGGKQDAYRVLARKYRPTSFADLMGQDALVRTLTNAFSVGRIAHAFMLTGVRGVGKTTTARIIAKGLNCVEGPTVQPCGKCEACVSITEGRNVDVLEMDAASRTGVGDIREIIEGVKYTPTSVRTKIYIIDEVHMLSNAAFNALLKTLEEPPPHVKFVFATTEIRKVPVTVLSRCQRFDLRRLTPDELMRLLAKIAKAEGVGIDDESLRMMARAADGSARDATSLLDQAIARSAGTVEGEQVRDMLGLADRSHILDLLVHTLEGKPADALGLLARLHADGADPLIVLQDLLDTVHQLARHKVLPTGQADPTLSEAERTLLCGIAEKTGSPALARAWQVLLKGVGEVQAAPQPAAALEMLLIRLAHIGSLPNPGDLIKRLTSAGEDVAITIGQTLVGQIPSGGGSGSSESGSGGMRGGENGGQAIANVSSLSSGSAVGGAAGTNATRAALSLYGQRPPPVIKTAIGAGILAEISHEAQVAPMLRRVHHVNDWREVVALFAEKREMQVYAQLYKLVECHTFAPPMLEVFPRSGALANLTTRLSQGLNEWTGQRWMISIAKTTATKTLAEEDEEEKQSAFRDVAEHPAVKPFLLAFTGSRIVDIREKVLEEPADAVAAFPAGVAGSMDEGGDTTDISGDVISLLMGDED